MKYVIFDLEFNQGFDNFLNKTVSNEDCPFEIIQIGAIKLDKNFNIIDKFNSYIKPNLYKKIHPFVSKITGITLDTVKKAPNFNEVYNNFLDFLGDDEIVFGIWGGTDIKELFRNISYNKLDCNKLSNKYINIQNYASTFLKNPSGKSIGLQNAITLLNVEQNKNYHDAFNDAYYTYEIFRRVYSKNIKIETFNLSSLRKKQRSRTRTKKVVDNKRLFKEFKTILNRDLTDSEKRIIYLSYTMGKKGEFFIDE